MGALFSGTSVINPDGSIWTVSATGDTGTVNSGPSPWRAPLAPLAPAAVAASTGVNPVETSYSLYGHPVLLTVFGVGRIGMEIIAGPWISGGLASCILSAGVPADPTGSRDIREIAFDSEVVWSTGGAAGVTTAAGGTFNTEAFTFRFYQGTTTQAADALETTHFGTNAVAYRPQILLAIENLPLAGTKFGKIPYVSIVVGDSSGDDVNLGEAFERIAASPWVDLAAFETQDITDGLVHGGLIIAQDYEFLQLIQQFGRFYTSWDILQTDKLRIVDRGSTISADIALDTTRLMDNIAVTRQGQDTIKKDLELSTIDPDADYTIVPFTAKHPRDPVAVTTSVGLDSAYLPAIMDASTRAAITTLALYHEESNRKSISGKATAFGLEIEPGARVTIRDLNDDFYNETYKIVETLHTIGNAVEFTAVPILKCSISGSDVYWDNVVLLLSFNGADASTTFTDESPAAHGDATVFGTAQVDTALSVFGGASGLFDGTTASLNFADDPDWNFGSGRFTVEARVRPSADGFIVGQWGVLTFFTDTVDLSWVMYRDSSARLGFNYSTSGLDNNVGVLGGTLTVGTWYAVCVDYDGTTLRAYIDGVMVSSNVVILSMANGTKPLAIASGSDNNFAHLSGSIDELRITKGVARYASDSGYTPAVAAFPRF